MIPVELPHYIVPFSGVSRLRRSHLDDLSFVSSVSPRIEAGPFARSFFYRTFPKWNRLPYDLRKLDNVIEFKKEVSEHMWAGIAASAEDGIT